MNFQNATTAKPLLLLFPFDQLAHYLRCLTLAKQLAPFYEIRVAHSQRYAPFIEQAGFQTFSCAGLDADAVLECVKRFDFSWINIKNLQPVLDQQIAAIETEKPVLVLGDAVPTLRMATEKTGVPYVALLNGYMTKYYAGVRTMSWRYPLYRYFKYLPSAVLDRLTKIGEQQTFYKIHQPFKTLRAHYGLLKKAIYPDELEGDLNLICDLPDLFPQRDLPAHYQAIPPLLYQAAAAEHEDLKKLDAGKRTVFVSMGSTGDWRQVAFLNAPAFQQYNLITAGDATGVLQGSHVLSLPFANVQQVFPRVDVVVCHGGNGTIYQALQSGIPVLCKTAHFEQEWNVQALQKNGLGASLDKLQNSADYLKAIEAWMGKKGSAPFRSVGQKMEAASGFDEAIAKMQSLLHDITKTVYYNTTGKQSA